MATYTSNYARKGNELFAIAISQEPPKWFEGYHFKQLAPTWDMIQAVRAGRMSHERYKELYLDILEKQTIDLHYLEDEFENSRDDHYLLCYEAPTDFCHRHLFTEWVEQKTGWVIPEWLNPKELVEQSQLKVVDELLQF